MHRLFGTGRDKAPPPSLDDATRNLENRGSVLDEKIAKLDAELARYRDQMKRTRGPALESIKRRALQTLKQKKMYEQQRDQLMQQQFNLDQTNFGIQNLKETAVTVNAMKGAATSLKQEYKKINITEVENLQDELSDLLDQANEIQDTISQSYGVPDDLDDADLEAELAGLEDELMTEGFAEATATPSYLEAANTPIGAAGQLPDLPGAEPAAPAAVDEFGLPEVPRTKLGA